MDQQKKVLINTLETRESPGSVPQSPRLIITANGKEHSQMSPMTPLSVVILPSPLSQEAFSATTCNSPGMRTITQEALLDAILVLFDECNQPAMRRDKNVDRFVTRYREAIASLRLTRPSRADYDEVRVLGLGAFGQVNLVRCKRTGEFYALKTLSKWEMLRRQAAACYEAERDLLLLAAEQENPWVVRLENAFQEESFLFLLTEYYAGGDLLSLLSSHDQDYFSEDMARFYAAEIVLALDSIHKLGYIHRDLKPDNILIDKFGHIKLGDFGSCLYFGDSEGALSQAPVGTPDYISPEMLASLEQKTMLTPATDFWSLGVILYEFLTGETPFFAETLAETYSKIQNYESTLTFPDHVSVDAQDLIRKLCCNVQNRLQSVNEICQHPFFSSIDWNEFRDRSAKPPFVPQVLHPADTTYFDDIDAQEYEERRSVLDTPKPRQQNSGFSGLQLPFVGFTAIPQLAKNRLPSLGSEAILTSEKPVLQVTNRFTGALDINRDKEQGSAAQENRRYDGVIVGALNQIFPVESQETAIKSLLLDGKKQRATLDVEELNQKSAAQDSNEANVKEKLKLLQETPQASAQNSELEAVCEQLLEELREWRLMLPTTSLENAGSTASLALSIDEKYAPKSPVIVNSPVAAALQEEIQNLQKAMERAQRYSERRQTKGKVSESRSINDMRTLQRDLEVEINAKLRLENDLMQMKFERDALEQELRNYKNSFANDPTSNSNSPRTRKGTIVHRIKTKTEAFIANALTSPSEKEDSSSRKLGNTWQRRQRDQSLSKEAWQYQQSQLRKDEKNSEEPKQQDHSFSARTFTSLTKCDHCGLLMRGVIRQGCQCNVCGITVHAKCSIVTESDCQSLESGNRSQGSKNTLLTWSSRDALSMSKELLAANFDDSASQSGWLRILKPNHMAINNFTPISRLTLTTSSAALWRKYWCVRDGPWLWLFESDGTRPKAIAEYAYDLRHAKSIEISPLSPVTDASILQHISKRDHPHLFKLVFAAEPVGHPNRYERSLVQYFLANDEAETDQWKFNLQEARQLYFVDPVPLSVEIRTVALPLNTLMRDLQPQCITCMRRGIVAVGCSELVQILDVENKKPLLRINELKRSYGIVYEQNLALLAVGAGRSKAISLLQPNLQSLTSGPIVKLEETRGSSSCCFGKWRQRTYLFVSGIRKRILVFDVTDFPVYMKIDMDLSLPDVANNVRLIGEGFIAAGCSTFYRLFKLGTSTFIDLPSMSSHAIAPVASGNVGERTDLFRLQSGHFLACFNAIGIIMEESGKKLVGREICWSASPTSFWYESPFLFVLYRHYLEIIQIDQDGYSETVQILSTHGAVDMDLSQGYICSEFELWQIRREGVETGPSSNASSARASSTDHQQATAVSQKVDKGAVPDSFHFLFNW